MNDVEARRIATLWIEEQGYSSIVEAGKCLETPNSYLFQLKKIEGVDDVYGNYPIAINRVSGIVSQPRGAMLEFFEDLSFAERIDRWFARKAYY